MAAAKAADPAATAKEEAEQKKAQARKALIDRENAYRLALYKQLRQRASVGALGLASLREFVKAVAEENSLEASLHDLYESDVSTDLDQYIDTADAGALQLLLIDLVLGHYLKIDWYDLMNDGSVDDEDGFATVVAMARHEGVDVDAARAATYEQESAATVVEQETQANEEVTDQAGADLGSSPVRYRNPSDPAQAWTGRGRQPKWVSEWVGSGKSLDALRVDVPAPADQVNDEQPADTAPAEANQVDGEQLAEQLAEEPATETSPSKKGSASKSGKSTTKGKTTGGAKASK